MDLESEHLGIQEIISLWKQHEARISSLEASLEELSKSLGSGALEPMGGRGTVLVVDDDPTLVETYIMLLERAGYSAEAAFNGFEALKKARRLHFDVAIVDMSLPDILGDELGRRLSEEREGLKFLMITGYSSYKERFESLGSGIKVLMKPVSVEEMLEALRELA